MFEPKDFRHAISPLIVINRVFGMVFSIEAYSSPKALEVLYSAVVITLYCGLTIVASGYFDTIYLMKTSQALAFAFKVLFYGNAGLAVSLTLIGWCTARKRNLAIYRTEVCDLAMERLGVPCDYRRIILRQLCFLAVLLVLTSLYVGTIFRWLFLDDTPLAIRFLLTLCIHYPLVLTYVIDLSFVCWVRYSSLKFGQLNDLLRSMSTSSSRTPQHRRILRGRNTEAKIDVSGNESQLRGRNFEERVNTIGSAKRVHLELTMNARTTNEAYGLQLLFSMTMSFVLITVLLYNAYNIAWKQHLSIEEFGRETVCLGCWIFFYAFKIFLVNHVCAQAMIEAANTGDIICELYEPSADKEFRTEIRDFTLQLVQNPLTFTACGFFNLDHTFVYGVIGSVTTYLVILIQVGDMSSQSSSSPNETSTPGMRSTTDESTITTETTSIGFNFGSGF